VGGAAGAYITPQRLPLWVTTVMQNRFPGCILRPGWLVWRHLGFDLMQVRDHTYFSEPYGPQAPSEAAVTLLGVLKVAREDLDQAKCLSWVVGSQQR
jgi:hypothetical protein